MILNLFKSKSRTNTPHQIYGTLMAQARHPHFFEAMGVPDTVMGRFDMLAMHIYLLSRRLKSESQDIATALSQDVFDLFIADVERALRELGVGDTTVPKRKKRMIHSFYAQIEEFDPVLVTNDRELLGERVKNRYLSEVENSGEAALSSYMLNTAELLDKQSFDTIVKGDVTWVELA